MANKEANFCKSQSKLCLVVIEAQVSASETPSSLSLFGGKERKV